MFAALFSALMRITGFLDGLLSYLRDNRLIALGEHRATEQTLSRLRETLIRVKTINNDVAALHRRRVDDSAFDASFKRTDDA
jgi:hypothetical protein